MPKAYSGDMRQRVIAEVESGASRRAAAEEFAVSASTAIIWVKCLRGTGRCAAKPRGGSISPLEEYADFLFGLIEKQPDLTLDEVVLAKRKHKIPGSRTAVCASLSVTRLPSKNACAQRSRSARDVARARRRWMREQGIFDPAHLVLSTRPPPIPRCCGFTAVAGAAPATVTGASDIHKSIPCLCHTYESLSWPPAAWRPARTLSYGDLAADRLVAVSIKCAAQWCWGWRLRPALSVFVK
jgi:transposase